MIRWPPDGLEDPSGSQRVPLACPHGCVVVFVLGSSETGKSLQYVM
jgi:hypothetical protein